MLMLAATAGVDRGASDTPQATVTGPKNLSRHMIEGSGADIGSIEAVEAGLSEARYIANRQTATAIYLARHLRKPVLVEGPAGVGKTELARATAQYLGLPLIRLQCYEGLDESKALYEWKYGKQLLYTQILKDTYGERLRGIATIEEALEKIAGFDDVFFSEQFLEPRPLLSALRQPNGAVLLVDEIDKSDQEFEAFLLEILSDFQVTIPEIGTIAATVPPLVVLTSNDSRDLGDALKRRCLHLHIGYPDAKLEERIVDVRVPGVEGRLREQIIAFVQKMRTFELKKLPSVSETIDWARALVLLHVTELDADSVRETLSVLLKYESDIESMKRHVSSIVSAVN
jgi:MoxR-like ATPase